MRQHETWAAFFISVFRSLFLLIHSFRRVTVVHARLPASVLDVSLNVVVPLRLFRMPSATIGRTLLLLIRALDVLGSLGFVWNVRGTSRARTLMRTKEHYAALSGTEMVST